MVKKEAKKELDYRLFSRSVFFRKEAKLAVQQIKAKGINHKENEGELNEDITSIIENVIRKMKELKKLIKDKDLEPAVVGQLLINLRYLTKHIAFKEEQEYRIVKICRINDENSGILPNEDFKQIYIEYKPKVSDHIEKIYFGPKATGMELFQDLMKHNDLNIRYEKSKNHLE